MSLVLPHPQPPPSHFPISRSSTPRPTTPISAPPTPITPTHLLPTAMERARSSDTMIVSGAEREGRKRAVKETMLGKLEWEHLERAKPIQVSVAKEEDEEKMDVDEDEDPNGSGVTLSCDLSMDKQPGLLLQKVEEAHAQTPTPTNLSADTIVGGITPIECVEPDLEIHLPTPPEEGKPYVWGMPRWGYEPQRTEIRQGVRTLAMAELPELIERHALIDTPSSVLFPWLHGISDDGQKGRDMAAFFGYGPPFEPPAYRGLCVVYAPPHPLDQVGSGNSRALRDDFDRTIQIPAVPITYETPPRERSETVSTSSESYHSTGTTEGTSPSIGDWNSPPVLGFEKLAPETEAEEEANSDIDVAMHPCDSKRVSPEAAAKGLDDAHHPLPCGVSHSDGNCDCSSSSDQNDNEDSDEDSPSCILFNALHVQDVFDLPPPPPPIPKGKGKGKGDQELEAQSRREPRFKLARLPAQINLRNLNIQQIKYSTVSDIVLYSKNGLGPGTVYVAEQIALAQENLYRSRMDEFYRHVRDSRSAGEGSDRPVRYGVWVIAEPFWRIEKSLPYLVNIDSRGKCSDHLLVTDLFEREAIESRGMTRGSEVVEGFWVGNDCDVPGGADDGAGAYNTFDLCVRASECAEMPTSTTLAAGYKRLLDLDKKKQASAKKEESTASESSWTASPATIALRNLLSPSPINTTSGHDAPVSAKRTASPSSPDDRKRRSRSSPTRSGSGSTTETEYVSLECAGSCRTITGQVRNLSQMTDKVIELVYFLRKIIEGKEKRKILIHCQDGYTESSIIVLSYIMSSLSISLPEAFLHLQLVARRSFFLYPSDKPLLRKIDNRLAADRRAKALKLIHATTPNPPTPTSPTSQVSSLTTGKASPRWKSWGLAFGTSSNSKQQAQSQAVTVNTVEIAKEMLVDQEQGGSKSAAEAKIWFDDRRFDGFPSRILPFLYLGNLEHAGNAAMLKALGITHVVSVGESLINTPGDHDPTYGAVGGNTLAAEARAGRISVLDLTDVRDDGNDPLRPLIARACTWIDHARNQGGAVLVHCRVGVSRSASIVIAYMMQYERMGLMDAYMMCRARRLNVLIQPNLRFFHELFGWEVELARQDMEACIARREEALRAGIRDPEALRLAQGERRRIVYSWPSFCRDLTFLVQLNQAER